ncbi:hypothetical protein [Actinacidiphila glaucinigra]|uniref:hypothetical protein n=1 Tax=Actinacidiphila glaucinigra TaxID=235986 RepID=UPI0035E2058F
MGVLSRRAAAAGCTIGALFLLVSCGESDVEVSARVLYGQWSNEKGAAFRFHPDRTFTTRHLEKSGVGPSTCKSIDDITFGSCLIGFNTTGAPGAPTLCLVIDPDQSCSDTEEFHRDDA